MYLLRLTYQQVVALVDIDTDYQDLDSPRWDGRTVNALLKRKFISMPRLRVVDKDERNGLYAKASLTKKGRAYLDAARFEYKTAEEFLAASEKVAASA